MAEVRLYRQIYQIIQNGNTDNYTLIDAFNISAATYDVSNSNAFVEAPVVTHESTGIYYASLDSTLYLSADTYDLIWTVNYLSLAPYKNLTTRFQLAPSGSGNTITYSNIIYSMDYEIKR